MHQSLFGIWRSLGSSLKTKSEIDLKLLISTNVVLIQDFFNVQFVSQRFCCNVAVERNTLGRHYFYLFESYWGILIILILHIFLVTWGYVFQDWLLYKSTRPFRITFIGFVAWRWRGVECLSCWKGEVRICNRFFQPSSGLNLRFASETSKINQ
jgi:hypothetical protein